MKLWDVVMCRKAHVKKIMPSCPIHTNSASYTFCANENATISPALSMFDSGTSISIACNI